MKFSKFENTYLLRIDRGEEIVSSIKDFCEKQDIKLGYFQGLGATNNAVLGLFKTSTKEYVKKEVKGDQEITCIMGNISQMNNEVYLHIHATLADENLTAIGGHLTSAVVSGTCEIVLVEVKGEVNRFFEEGVGLNIYDF